MPAGVSWLQYTKFLTCAMLAMMAGSEVVHIYYKPLDDLPVYIEREITQRKDDKINGGVTTTTSTTSTSSTKGDNV